MQVGRRDPRIEEALERRGNDDREGIRSLLEQVVAEKAAGYAEAAIWLGLIREGDQDFEGAEAAYRLALDSGDPEEAPQAAINLGHLLRDDVGDPDGAQEIFQLAVDSGHPDHTVAGLNNLGYVAEMRGDFDGAKRFFAQAIDAGNEAHSPWAVVCLGQVLESQGERELARELYERAIASGASHVQEDAGEGLARVLDEGA